MSIVPDPCAPPWNAEAIQVPKAALDVPTMLSDEESRLLYWLCRDHVTGAGAICDLGCFLGGSTARMAAGTAAGAGASLHAYDRFTLGESQKKKYLDPIGIKRFQGEDMLFLAKRFLASWGDAVTLHRGDITEQAWTGGPIEVLFVDAGKTPESTDTLSRIFMPSLIPEQSFVIAQDYQHWRQPWIAAQMELLSDCFDMVGWCQSGTVLFQCIAPVTETRLDDARTADLDDAALTVLLRRAITRFPMRPQRVKLARAIMGIEDNPGIRVPPEMSPEHFRPARVKVILDRI